MSNLPKAGYLRLPQIIGDKRRDIPAIIPVSRSSWFAGVRSGRYPAPIKLGSRTAAWKVQDILGLIDRLNTPPQTVTSASSRAHARDFAVAEANTARCGAKRRRSHHRCDRPIEDGKTRCKFHGGLSTGPVTDAGKAVVAGNLPAQHDQHNGQNFAKIQARMKKLRRSRNNLP